jgi:hypothetical protein
MGLENQSLFCKLQKQQRTFEMGNISEREGNERKRPSSGC